MMVTNIMSLFLALVAEIRDCLGDDVTLSEVYRGLTGFGRMFEWSVELLIEFSIELLIELERRMF